MVYQLKKLKIMYLYEVTDELIEEIKNNDDYYHNVKKYVKELTL